jgi:hypothetical protein
MDNQQLFNLVVSVAGFLAVYVINNLTRQIQRLEDELRSLPHDYVQKMLKQIFDKLDGKADK